MTREEEALAAPLRVHPPRTLGIARDGRPLLGCCTLGVDELDEVAATAPAARA